ncbi:hypothetical protein SO694_000611114 [Aureococcus anophagefferens]|uniref:Uncharacterized protein n=1 Tax=Aureococcus anophagefferens TaxID=44056 RepID=A0ABR1FRA8_AURAN
MAAQLTMYIVRKKGALVREGASLDTREIADLAPGTRCESDAIETLPYGKKRVRLPGEAARGGRGAGDAAAARAAAGGDVLARRRGRDGGVRGRRAAPRGRPSGAPRRRPPPPPPRRRAPRSPAVVASEAERTIRDAVAASSPHYRRTHTREVLAKIPAAARRPGLDERACGDAGKPRGTSVVTALDSGSLADTAAWAAGDSPRSARRRFEEPPRRGRAGGGARPRAGDARGAGDARAGGAGGGRRGGRRDARAGRECRVGGPEPTPAPRSARAGASGDAEAPAATPEPATTPAELSRTELPWSAAEPATPTSPPADDPRRLSAGVKIDATRATPAAELGRAKARPAWRLAEGALSPPRVVAALAPTTPKGRKRLAAMFVALVVLGATNLLSSFWGLGGGQKPYAPGTPSIIAKTGCAGQELDDD